MHCHDSDVIVPGTSTLGISAYCQAARQLCSSSIAFQCDLFEASPDLLLYYTNHHLNLLLTMHVASRKRIQAFSTQTILERIA